MVISIDDLESTIASLVDRDESNGENAGKPNCGDGICISPTTGNSYYFGEKCHPEQFNKSTCDQCSEKV